MKCQVTITGRNSSRFLGNRKACIEFFQSQLKKDNLDRYLCWALTLTEKQAQVIGEEMSQKAEDEEVDVNRLLGTLLVPQTPPNR